MYDPIILEDFTLWLNAGQLDQAGYDGEVAPGDVKKWCESKQRLLPLASESTREGKETILISMLVWGDWHWRTTRFSPALF